MRLGITKRMTSDNLFLLICEIVDVWEVPPFQVDMDHHSGLPLAFGQNICLTPMVFFLGRTQKR